MNIASQFTLACGVMVWSEEGMAAWPNKRWFLMVCLAVFWPELRNQSCVGVISGWRVSALLSSGQGFNLLTLTFPVENTMQVIHRTESEGIE